MIPNSVKFIYLTGFLFSAICASSQTLFVPSGSSGIGTSATSNVGVGISNPAKTLHVQGQGAFGDAVTSSNSTRALNMVSSDAVLRILRISPDIGPASPAIELMHRTSADGSNTRYWDIYVNNTGMTFRDRLALNVMPFTIENASPTNSLYIRSTGSVGVGTSSPLGKFNVNVASGQATMFLTSGSSGGALLSFQRYGSSSSYYALETGAANNDDLRLYVNGNSSTPLMAFKSNNTIGVGTSSPEAVLTIQQPGSGWNDGLRINRNGSNYLTLTEDVTDIRLKNWGAGGIRFFTSSVEALTILNNGKIGIGTATTGNHRLAVEGSVGAREVKVEASGWSDYVFEDDYALTPLSELETYVKEHHHLPEVPSEQEVLENGVELGATVNLLLKKIEELTLYTIEQQKEIEALKKKIEK